MQDVGLDISFRYLMLIFPSLYTFLSPHEEITILTPGDPYMPFPNEEIINKVHE